VQTQDATGDVEVAISPETNALYEGPLVVLTSRLSASSSEIVAGALQDYGRALIAGDSATFGKGTVQTVVPLKELFHRAGLGAVEVTIRKFYRPSGASTQLRGVVPDIILPSETDLPSIGESKLPNALPWDVMPPTTYTNFNLVHPVISKLRERSRTRIGSDPWFRLVLKELATIVTEATKPLSLNEAARRRENDKTDLLKAQMNQVQLAASARTAPTYDIAPADVDGLPISAKLTSAVAVAQLAQNSPKNDMELHETENILADYIQLLQSARTTRFVGDRSAGFSQK
jgi:carboxyl-terminal processing protease